MGVFFFLFHSAEALSGFSDVNFGWRGIGRQSSIKKCVMPLPLCRQSRRRRWKGRHQLPAVAGASCKYGARGGRSG